jgi:hypothetical protein
VLQRAETARVTANGLTNPKHFESRRVNDQTAQMSSYLSSATFPGAFTINGTGSAVINYTGTTTLAGLASLINLETGTTGVTATVVQDGSGYRLDLDGVQLTPPIKWFARGSRRQRPPGDRAHKQHGIRSTTGMTLAYSAPSLALPSRSTSSDLTRRATESLRAIMRCVA